MSPERVVAPQLWLSHTKSKVKEGRSYCICEKCRHSLPSECMDKHCKCCTAMVKPAPEFGRIYASDG